MIPCNSFIHPTAVVGEAFRWYQGGKKPEIEYDSELIGENVYIGAGVVIGRGVKISSGVVIDHQCIIESNCVLEDNVLLLYRAVIGCEAKIGRDSVIGGFIAERCIIGERCRIFGQIVHRQSDSTQSWDEHETPEQSAIVYDDSFIGFGAVISGGIRIGPRSFVCAGAVVTRDLPERHIASGINCFIPFAQWRGRLSRNPMFLKED